MNDPRAVPAPGAVVHVIHPRPPILLAGDRWQRKVEGPWPTSQPTIVTILGTDGDWVRFDRGVRGFNDERTSLTNFLYLYQPAPAEVVRSEEEQLRERFERWASGLNWSLDRMPGHPDAYRFDVVNGGWHGFKAAARGLGV